MIKSKSKLKQNGMRVNPSMANNNKGSYKKDTGLDLPYDES